ncbi:hypothetical protein N9N67_12635, partial [Bacteriovoracaceae bacterium]|nr:hypothetical protein [Bacteriovoracaceae bacterium]
ASNLNDLLEAHIRPPKVVSFKSEYTETTHYISLEDDPNLYANEWRLINKEKFGEKYYPYLDFNFSGYELNTSTRELTLYNVYYIFFGTYYNYFSEDSLDFVCSSLNFEVSHMEKGLPVPGIDSISKLTYDTNEGYWDRSNISYDENDNHIPPKNVVKHITCNIGEDLGKVYEVISQWDEYVKKVEKASAENDN